MKKIIPVLLIAFAPLFSKSQTYTPLNLDSSCFWVQEYYDSYPGPSFAVNGTVLNYVEKDTLIGLNTYQRIRGYATQAVPIFPMMSSDQIQLIMQYRCYNPILYLREDTILKKVFRYFPAAGLEYEYFSFDLQLGDSISYSIDTVSTPVPPIFAVDSIRLANYYGITSRTYFASANFNTYERIEGIGALINFPIDWRIEFGAPVFRTSYYLKGADIIYKNQVLPDSLCVRLPRAYNPCGTATSLDQIEQKKLIHYSNNVLSIEIADRFSISLFSIAGQLLFKANSESNYYQNFSSYPTGFYILSLQSSKGIENRKILIR